MSVSVMAAVSVVAAAVYTLPDFRTDSFLLSVNFLAVVNYFQASVELLPVSADYFPASAAFLPASVELLPASAAFLPVSAVFLPASVELLPASAVFPALAAVVPVSFQKAY